MGDGTRHSKSPSPKPPEKRKLEQQSESTPKKVYDGSKSPSEISAKLPTEKLGFPGKIAEISYGIMEKNSETSKSSLQSQKDQGNFWDSSHGEVNKDSDAENYLAFKSGFENRLTDFRNKLEQYQNNLRDNDDVEVCKAALGEAEKVIDNHAQEIENNLQTTSDIIKWIRKQNKVKSSELDSFVGDINTYRQALQNFRSEVEKTKNSEMLPQFCQLQSLRAGLLNFKNTNPTAAINRNYHTQRFQNAFNGISQIVTGILKDKGLKVEEPAVLSWADLLQKHNIPSNYPFVSTEVPNNNPSLDNKITEVKKQSKEVKDYLAFKSGFENRLTSFRNELEQHQNKLRDSTDVEVWKTTLGEAEKAIGNHAQEIENDLQATSNIVEWIRKQNKVQSSELNPFVEHINTYRQALKDFRSEVEKTKNSEWLPQFCQSPKHMRATFLYFKNTDHQAALNPNYHTRRFQTAFHSISRMAIDILEKSE